MKKKKHNKVSRTKRIKIINLLKFREPYFSFPKDNEKVFNVNDYYWIPELEEVTKNLENIFSNPKTHILINKEKKTTETVVRIDNEDIKETLKKPGNLLVKGNDVIPEKIFSNDYDIDYAIYENRFLVLFIDDLILFLNSNLKRLFNYASFLSKKFQNDVIDISSYLAEFKVRNSRNQNYYLKRNISKRTFLNNEEDLYIETLHSLLTLRKKLMSITSNRYYKIIKNTKNLTDKEIHSTNILKENSLYAPCYTFYIKLKKLKKTIASRNQKNQKSYNQYVLKEILNKLKREYFKLENKTVRLTKNNKLITRKFRVKSPFMNGIVLIKNNHIDLEFLVKTRNRLNPKESRISRISLDLYASYSDETSFNETVKKIVEKRLRKGYTNAFVITQTKLSGNQNVVVSSPHRTINDFNMRHLIDSLFIFAECNKFLYLNMCPVCGAQITMDEKEPNKHCYVCDSSYSMMRTRGKDIMWVKRLMNKN